MGTRLDVIALISGGKDSLFSILHCLANGHRVVALGNLHPPSASKSASEEKSQVGQEDIDSYMYQTVGHSIIPLYQDALQIPLYRQEISGSAVNQDKDYAPLVIPGHDGGDETESLVPLLKRIIANHPQANAVCTGAILSTYQRTRVESVAVRLNLIPLSYLWQYTSLPPYTQASLLQDMNNVGQKSRIVKVSSGGLDRRFLWEEVTSPQVIQRLRLVMARFGADNGSILGEGGEFETLSLDGPYPLWKQRIVVSEHSNCSVEGDSSFVVIGKTHLEPKTSESTIGNPLRIPPKMDDEFRHVLLQLHECIDAFKPRVADSTEPRNEIFLPLGPVLYAKRNGFVLQIANLHSAPGASPEEQMTRILQLVKEVTEVDPSVMTIVSSTLLLRSMADFVSLNSIYGTLFTQPNPAARVTVACGDLMPEDVHVILSLVISKSVQKPRGLHVQSRSYWAPANIGPYSQAMSVSVALDSARISDESNNFASEKAEFVYIAGQIPLVPASMELISSNDLIEAEVACTRDDLATFQAQSVLALQHLWRIGRATSVDSWAGAVAFIPACQYRTATVRQEIAAKTWEFIHQIALASHDAEEEATSDVDVWDLQNRPDLILPNDGPVRSALPNFEKITYTPTCGTKIPPCFVVQVDHLPRAAQIEWVSGGFAGCNVRLSIHESNGLKLHVIHGESTCITIAWAAVHDNDGFSHLIPAISPLWFWTPQSDYQTTIYTTIPIPPNICAELQPLIIPCQRVWDADGNESKAIVMLRCLQSRR